MHLQDRLALHTEYGMEAVGPTQPIKNVRCLASRRILEWFENSQDNSSRDVVELLLQLRKKKEIGIGRGN
jgi:hypothetical protein